MALLRVTSEYFVAGVEFTKTEEGAWKRRSAPILRKAIQGLKDKEIPAELDRRGWQYEWIR